METLNNIKCELTSLGYSWQEEYNGATLDFEISKEVHNSNDVYLRFYVLVNDGDITQASEMLSAVIMAVLPWAGKS